MSRAILFAAPEGGEFRPLREYGNSWGGAARVWSAVSRRYFGDDAYWLTQRPQLGHPFWELARREDVALNDRIVHASTFDRAIVTRENFSRMAALFREFDRKYPVGVGVANHLPAWADALDRLAVEAHGLDFSPYAVGWHHTTVTSNPWWVSGESEDDEGRPYNLTVDHNHYDVFAEFDKPETCEAPRTRADAR